MKKIPEYKEAVRKQKFRELCVRAGLIETSDNHFDRGDHFSIQTVEFVWKKRDLAQYQASGSMLGLARQTRKRVYAHSSDWRFSERTDSFVVGENENGNPFLHQVPNHIVSLQEAWAWIWREAQIIARQGDIGIASSPLKHKEGEEDDIAVGGGHSRHRFIGEIYQNGSLHVRSGFLVHTAGQHPPVYLDGSCWRRIVLARRSEVGMSSRD